MNHSPTALNRLREATHDIHVEFESTLHIARATAGKHEYQHFIQAMWGWLSPFEQILWSASWPEDMQAAQRAGKIAWLRSDLTAIGLSDAEIAALPLAPVSVDLDSQAARYGVAYVLEGSQLGSAMLFKRMGPVLQPWPAHWLQGYGDACGQYWRHFMQSANRHLADEASCQQASKAARDTFLSLRAWFIQRGAA